MHHPLSGSSNSFLEQQQLLGLKAHTSLLKKLHALVRFVYHICALSPGQ
jgi:hypothetical protein